MTCEIRAEASSGGYPITLVTAYFALERKGRSVRDYHKWMGNFLPFVRWPMVIFCDEQSLDTVKRLRGRKPAVYLVTDYEEFHVYQYRDIFRKCPPGSPIELKMVWYEKPNFLRRAIEMDSFASEMFFWTDIGSYRLDRDRAIFSLSERLEWPDLRVCRAAFQDKVGLFGVIDPHKSPPENLMRVWGGFFGGSVVPVLQFCNLYYQCFEERCLQGEPNCSDETLLRVVYNAQPDIARLLQIKDVGWLRWCDFLKPFSHWYCLSGDRFPWKYFCDEILRRPSLLLRGGGG